MMTIDHHLRNYKMKTTNDNGTNMELKTPTTNHHLFVSFRTAKEYEIYDLVFTNEIPCEECESTSSYVLANNSENIGICLKCMNKKSTHTMTTAIELLSRMECGYSFADGIMTIA